MFFKKKKKIQLQNPKQMVRTLKYHESKLLKKTNFMNWKRDGGRREAMLMTKYHIHNPEEVSSYDKATNAIRKLSNMLENLPKDDTFRIAITKRLCDRLFVICL